MLSGLFEQQPWLLVALVILVDVAVEGVKAAVRSWWEFRSRGEADFRLLP